MEVHIYLVCLYLLSILNDIFRIMLCYGLNYSQRELPVLNVCFGISILLILSELDICI